MTRNPAPGVLGRYGEGLPEAVRKALLLDKERKAASGPNWGDDERRVADAIRKQAELVRLENLLLQTKRQIKNLRGAARYQPQDRTAIRIFLETWVEWKPGWFMLSQDLYWALDLFCILKEYPRPSIRLLGLEMRRQRRFPRQVGRRVRYLNIGFSELAERHFPPYWQDDLPNR